MCALGLKTLALSAGREAEWSDVFVTAGAADRAAGWPCEGSSEDRGRTRSVACPGATPTPAAAREADPGLVLP